jgi:hypothetical protein
MHERAVGTSVGCWATVVDVAAGPESNGTAPAAEDVGTPNNASVAPGGGISFADDIFKVNYAGYNDYT